MTLIDNVVHFILIPYIINAQKVLQLTFQYNKLAKNWGYNKTNLERSNLLFVKNTNNKENKI